MSKLCFLLVFALSTASAQPRAPVPLGPDALMSALTTEVMATLREDKAAGRTTDLAQLVEARIVPVFDFQRMTSLALARNWRLASAEQQKVLAAQFQLLLVRTYSLVLLEFRDQAINYRPVRAAPGENEVTVRSTMRRSGVEPLTIDYEMADGPARVESLRREGGGRKPRARLPRFLCQRGAQRRHRWPHQGARGAQPAEPFRDQRGGEAGAGAHDLRRLDSKAFTVGISLGTAAGSSRSYSLLTTA